ncbi:hypothetical protein ACHAWF_001765 [Thalassiosira exigua]
MLDSLLARLAAVEKAAGGGGAGGPTPPSPSPSPSSSSSPRSVAAASSPGGDDAATVASLREQVSTLQAKVTALVLKLDESQMKCKRLERQLEASSLGRARSQRHMAPEEELRKKEEEAKERAKNLAAKRAEELEREVEARKAAEVRTREEEEKARRKREEEEEAAAAEGGEGEEGRRRELIGRRRSELEGRMRAAESFASGRSPGQTSDETALERAEARAEEIREQREKHAREEAREREATERKAREEEEEARRGAVRRAMEEARRKEREVEAASAGGEPTGTEENISQVDGEGKEWQDLERGGERGQEGDVSPEERARRLEGEVERRAEAILRCKRELKEIPKGPDRLAKMREMNAHQQKQKEAKNALARLK